MLAFLLVLYSTFLTRSGVLGDTSVHSFVEPGMWVYGLLVAFMLVFISLGAGLFFLRLKDMPKVPVQHSALSREFVLFLGAVVLTAIALVVLLGTSAPLLLSIFHQKAAAMDAAFYAKTNLPLGIVLAVLAGVGQWLSWKDSSAQSLARRLLWPFVLAACATILVSFLGDLEIITGLFICASAFAAISNAFLAADVLKMNPKLSGGVLAHIGIALMFIGFVTSSRFSEKQTLSLERGKSTSAYGYQLTYTGYNQRPDGKYAMGIEVQSGMTLYTATPLMFSGEQAENIMRVPDIVRFISRDLYLEPVSVEDSSAAAPGQLMKLSKDVPGEFNGLRLRFTGYDFSTEQRSAMMAGKPFEMNASLVVAEGMKETTLQLKMQSAEGAMTMVPAPYTAKDGQRYEFAIGKMFPAGEKEKAALELAITTGTSSAVGHGETLIVEATIKPFIGLVWTGTFVLVIGFALALRRRVIEARGV
jgi:cytochrome c-type biogenesis protein CcmF